MRLFRHLVTQSEGFAKGLLFGCQRCGQCALTSTRLVCPMTCPKQLRNGPCGGTCGERCEVHPERPCVWVRIQKRRHGDRIETPPQLPAIDPTLRESASYLNLFSGADRAGRTALPPLEQKHRVDQVATSGSELEAALREGQFVFTTELRAPRGASTARLRDEVRLLRGAFAACNITAYLGGAPSLPPELALRELIDLDLTPVAQATARDLSRHTFLSHCTGLRHLGCRDLLCLTGDWATNPHTTRQVFECDSSLLLRLAHEQQAEMPVDQRLFLGAAINPFSTPWQVPVRRLLQKAAAGAQFIQTQLVCDGPAFHDFSHRCADAGLSDRLFMLAGVPLITSRSALHFLKRIPGVVLPPGFIETFERYDDIAPACLDWASSLIERLRDLPGINGVHCMLFGRNHDLLVALRERFSEPAAPAAVHPLLPGALA